MRSISLTAVRRLLYATVATTVVTAAVVGAAPAAAEPATTLSYPRNASATRLNGYAFDACAAPSAAAMAAWSASPYDGIGVYIGGPNRTCAQPNLTASWVSTVSRGGWRIIPIYMGRQAPCTYRVNAREFTASNATSYGTSDAADAAAKAAALGMRGGTAIYGDMEHYNAADTTCRTAVRRYVSAWTKELHRRGYLAGVYAHLYSGAKHLSDSYGSTSYARPDALWIARWDNSPALTGWLGVPDSRWAGQQRGKQYRGDHNETHGGVTINIDSDRFDAPVATVGYAQRVTSSSSLNGRSAPTTSAAAVASYPSGATVTVICQTPGTTVNRTAVWDKLSDGNYVSDAYVNTSSSTGYSAPIPRCGYPFQVTATTASKRTGPGTSYPTAGSLSSGALAWIYCQRSGSKVGATKVWNRLLDTRYFSDSYVATPSWTSYSAPIPRC